MSVFQYQELILLTVSSLCRDLKSIDHLHISLLALSVLLVKRHIARQAKSRMRRRSDISEGEDSMYRKKCRKVSWSNIVWASPSQQLPTADIAKTSVAYAGVESLCG